MIRAAMISGASRGIGAAIARALARDYSVGICYNSSRLEAEALVSELTNEGFTAMCVHCDVTNEDEIHRAYNAISEQLGHVEVLINNAGITQQKPFCDISAQEMRKMLDVHITGSMLCAQSVLPAMLQRHCGSIVNIASMWGEVGGACEVHYSAAKAAVIGFTKALAKEMSPSGIRVNCVSPGAIDTAMLANLSREDKNLIVADTPLGRLGTPNDIAALVQFLCTDSAGFITGQVFGVNGGLII